MPNGYLVAFWISDDHLGILGAILNFLKIAIFCLKFESKVLSKMEEAMMAKPKMAEIQDDQIPKKSKMAEIQSASA